MFNELFGTQNSIVTFISKFGPRKGQYQVNIDQIRSNFQIQNFLARKCLSSPVLSQDPVNVIDCYLRLQEKPKNTLQESNVITFTLVFGNCTAKNVDIALKFCMRVVCTGCFIITVTRVSDHFWHTWRRFF